MCTFDAPGQGGVLGAGSEWNHGENVLCFIGLFQDQLGHYQPSARMSFCCTPLFF